MSLVLFLSSCQTDSTITNPEDEPATDQEAMLKLVEEDENIQSFEPNYNEDDAMSLIGKVSTEIFPVRVGQRMTSISRNLDITFDGDSAYGVLTHSFEGILFIAASYDSVDFTDSAAVDTVLQKPFSTTITRNIIFEKIANTRFPLRNWRIAAISLLEGGTANNNIEITKLTVFTPDGDSIEVANPNGYYLEKFPGIRRQIPVLYRFQEVMVRVELRSKYPDNDFVSLTYGAIPGGRHYRAKKLFEIVSSDFDGEFYNRVYELTWITRQHRGPKHAIINALPYQVLHDDAADVEVSTWGIPYIVR